MKLAPGSDGRGPCGSLPARRCPWGTLAFVATGCLVAACPGAGAALQYDRRLVAGGEVWRLLTAQLVHLTMRMGVADLGAILILGSWLEIQAGKRQTAAAALALALGATAAFLPLSSFDIYRGSSGLASALFVLAALDTQTSSRTRLGRGLAATALTGFAAKLLAEAAGVAPIAAGQLPPGIAVATAVHLLGGAAGALAAQLPAWRRARALRG